VYDDAKIVHQSADVAKAIEVKKKRLNMLKVAHQAIERSCNLPWLECLAGGRRTPRHALCSLAQRTPANVAPDGSVELRVGAHTEQGAAQVSKVAQQLGEGALVAVHRADMLGGGIAGLDCQSMQARTLAAADRGSIKAGTDRDERAGRAVAAAGGGSGGDGGSGVGWPRGHAPFASYQERAATCKTALVCGVLSATPAEPCTRLCCSRAQSTFFNRRHTV
jgi:hypothetical protein